MLLANLLVIGLSVVSFILGIGAIAMNKGISPGLDSGEHVYLNTLIVNMNTLLQQSKINTLLLSNAEQTNVNTTIDVISLPKIEACQETNNDTNIVPLGILAQQQRLDLLAFNTTIDFGPLNADLTDVITSLNTLATALQNTGILMNHTVIQNTTTTGWDYQLQSITLGNELLYYLKVYSNQSYVVPLNNTYEIPLETNGIVFNIDYLVQAPILDAQANKLINAPSGVDLYKRAYNTTLALSTSLVLDANDILFVLKDLKISF